MNGAVPHCTACGNANRAAARYCDQCGAALTAAGAAATEPVQPAGYTPRHLAERILNTRAAMQGERKPVTVLFADVKDSTRLAEKIGAEAWHEVLNRFFAVLSAAVHRYEGTVNQYTGDGIMALFGAPIAHEDHAPRAALAALEMQREVRSYADELRAARGIELGLRIGLNTGEVVVGRIGDDLRMDYTAKGLTVNLAARMEQICVPGSINLSRYTAAGLREGFELEDLGEREVQGSSHPIRVYRLLGERSERSARLHETAGAALAYIGREAELETLRSALATLEQGNGRIVVVSGEPGIGKSRLLREFAAHCGALGIAMHRSAGVAYASAAPLRPVRLLLRSRLGLGENADVGEIQQQVRQAFAAYGHSREFSAAVVEFVQSGAPAQPAALHSLMLERIARYLSGGSQPQVLAVEDLHYADRATEDFLTRLCEQVASGPTLLLLTHRTEYAGRWFMPYIDAQIALMPLPAESLERLALALLGPARNLPAVARRIVQRADGNPFFVEEAVQALVDAGYLWGTRGNYAQTRAIDEWPIPQSVQALVAGRIDRLPEAQKSLLQAAAVIGRSFGAGLLAACTGDTQTAQHLQELEQAGFVRATATPDTYEFCHGLSREVCYHAQLEAQRAATHAAVARELSVSDPLDGAPQASALRIAEHWALAQDWSMAGAWNIQAARWCAPRDIVATLAQFRLAVTHFDRADFSFDTLRQRVAARAGLIRMGQFTPVAREEIETAYHDGWKMVEEFSDIESGAELLFSYASELLHRGEAERAVQLVAQAVADAEAVGALDMIQRFRFLVLMAHNAAGRLAQGLELATRAGDDWLQRTIDDENFMSRGFYGALRLWQGALDEAHAELQASIAYAEAVGRESIWQHADLVEWAWFSGDATQALAHGEAAVQAARAFGSPFFEVIAEAALGAAQLLAGDAARAVTQLESASVKARAGGFARSRLGHCLALLAAAYERAGRREQALATAQQAIEVTQEASTRIFELHAWITYIRLDGPQAGQGRARVRELIELTGARAFEAAAAALQVPAAAGVDPAP